MFVSAAVENSVFQILRQAFAHQPRIAQLPRLGHPPSAEEFLTLCLRGYPFIYPLDLPHTSWESICKTLGQESLEVESRQSRFRSPGEYDTGRILEKHSLKEFLAHLDGDSPYAGVQLLPKKLAHALGAHPPEFVSLPFASPSFWIGPRGARTPLHKDGSDNFAMHIWGSKRWFLFPLADASVLDYRPRTGQPEHIEYAISHATAVFPSSPEFELQTGRQPLVVDVRAGEALYVPAGWGHAVENLSLSLMINHWHDRDAFAASVRSRFGVVAFTPTR